MTTTRLLSIDCGGTNASASTKVNPVRIMAWRTSDDVAIIVRCSWSMMIWFGFGLDLDLEFGGGEWRWRGSDDGGDGLTETNESVLLSIVFNFKF